MDGSPAIGVTDIRAVISTRAVYITSQDGHLYSIDLATGNQNWDLDLGNVGGGITSSPTVGTDGTVYVHSNDGHLYAVRPNGTIKWAATAPSSENVSCPALGADGTIYITADDNSLFAVSPDGVHLPGPNWPFIPDDDIESSPVIGPDCTVYFLSGGEFTGGAGGSLFAVSRSGLLKWKFPLGLPDDVQDYRFALAVGGDGTVYCSFGGNADTLIAINPSNQTEKWRFPATGQQPIGPIQSSPAIGPDGTIYVSSTDGKLYALNPANGAPKWATPFSTGASIASSPAVASDGTIYVGASDNNLYAVNPNGSQKWVFSQATAAINSSPAIAPDGTVIVGSDDGNVYAVSASGSAPLANSAWPMFRKNLSHSASQSTGYCVEPCATPPLGILSWWPGDGTTTDIIGGNNGTQTGAAGFAPAEVNQGFVFFGSAAGVQVGTAAPLQLQDFSIEGWISRSDPNNVCSDAGDDALFFGFGSGGYGFGLNAAGEPMLTQIDVNSLTPGGVIISDTALHHLAVTKTGTTVVFYVDGVALPAAQYDSVFSFNSPAAVGARGDNLRNSFAGTVDELSVYGRALSGGEIQAIFMAGHVGKCRPSCVLPPSGIISWWPGDGTTADIIGGNNGTPTGAAGYGAAEVNLGFVFSGSAAGVQVGTAASLQLQDFSIEGWIRRSSLDNVCSDAGDDALFFGFGSGGYGFGLNAAGEPLLTQIDVNSLTPGGVVISDTALHHLAVTRSGSTVVFYVDGVPLPAASYGSVFSFDSPAAVGARGDNMRNSFLGTVDELSIYGRALSVEEIQTIFMAGQAGKCHPSCVPPPSDIISWWPGDGTTLDIVGGNNGTQTGVAGYGLAEVNQGFVFSGSAAGVQVGNPPSLQLQDFSIEGWISRSSLDSVCSDAGDDALFFGFGSGGYGFGLNSAGEPLLTQIDVNSLTPGGVFISDTALHHLAVTKSGNTVVFYLDGVALPAAAYDSVFSFENPAAVGARGDNMRNSFLGTVDELSIYGRPLSADEIQTIFLAGHAGKCRPCVPPPSGIISWWPGDGATTDIISGNNGTQTGPAGYGPAEVNLGFAFSGSAAGVQVGNPPSLQLQDFSIEGWIRRSDPNNVCSDAGDDALFFGFGSGGYGFGLNAAGEPLLTRVDIDALTPGGVFVLDTAPHHLALTKSGSTVVFYVDGVPLPAAEYDSVFSFGYPAAVGARGDNMRNSFAGTVDELSIYDRALSATEIQAIFTAGHVGKCR